MAETRRRTVHNTAADPDTPLRLLLAAALGERYPGEAIEEMEAAGQAQLVDSDVLPVDVRGGSDDDLTRLGFGLGDQVPGDALFRYVALPAGWSRAACGHAMWSYVLDQYGRRRLTVFYKAAPYDRRAFCHLVSLGEYVGQVADGEGPLILDDTWATRAAVTAVIADQLDAETARVDELRQLGLGRVEVSDGDWRRAELRASRLEYLGGLAADLTLTVERHTPPDGTMSIWTPCPECQDPDACAGHCWRSRHA